MKDLEFLPQHHIRARQNQRLRFLRLWLLAILALSMVCWGFYSRHDIAQARGELAAVMAQMSPAETEEQRKLLTELIERERTYMAQAGLVGQLSNLWPRASLVRDVSRCLPEQIVLTRLEIERQTRDVVNQLLPPDTTGQRRPAGTTKETVDRVRIEGFAADDLSLSRFLQSMGERQTFQRGELAFSKDATFRGREVRVFAATFYVPVQPGQVAATGQGLHQGGRS